MYFFKGRKIGYGRGDGFQGSESVLINPGDSGVSIGFNFPVASSSGKSDGAIPFGSTLNSATITAHRGGDGVATTGILGPTTDYLYDGNTVYLPLTYATDLNAGYYHLDINAEVTVRTTSNFMEKEFEFDRVRITT